jgi:hypothetical protein
VTVEFPITKGYVSMKKILCLVAAVLLVVLSLPASAQDKPAPHSTPTTPTVTVASCSVHTFQKGDGMAGLFRDEAHILKASKARTVYLCDAFYGGGSIMQVTVPKAWFAQHCDAAPNYADGAAAHCDEVYMGAGAPARIADAAAPLGKVRAHLKAFGYGAAAAGVLALCVVGGCGFMGGGVR